MSLNIERFIYAQLSLVLFVYMVNKLKNKDSYIIDIVAIPLFGITLTNIYLYFINLILEFKVNIAKVIKHMGILVFNVVLHGLIGYNLENANIMAIHFSFAIIIIRLAHLLKNLNRSQIRLFNILIVLLTVIISNVFGFA